MHTASTRSSLECKPPSVSSARSPNSLARDVLYRFVMKKQLTPKLAVVTTTVRALSTDDLKLIVGGQKNPSTKSGSGSIQNPSGG